MNFTISIPSKTFLVGEYAALTGGPTLIINTSPRFQLHVHTDHDAVCGKQENISSESPAGKFLATHIELGQETNLHFHDPHQEQGGFGASTAQFAQVFTALKIVEGFKTKTFEFDPNTLLPTYLQHAAVDGISPSGADLIAQLQGGICFYSKNHHQLEILNWPFTDLDFCLIRTGKKLATHTHLSELDKVDFSDLETIALICYESLKVPDKFVFIKTVTHYANALQKHGLVAAHTKTLLSLILDQAGVVAAKGCGAQGADVILVLLEKSFTLPFQQWLKQQDLTLVATQEQITEGMLIE